MRRGSGGGGAVTMSDGGRLEGRRRDLLVIMMAAYAVAYFCLMRLPGDILRSPIAGTDLSSYYTAGYLARTGQAGHLYEVESADAILGDATAGPWREAGDRLGLARQHYYIYPPFFAMAVSPLSLLPFPAARLIWLALDLTLLGLFIWIYLTWRRGDGVRLTTLEVGLIAITLGLEFLPLIWALAIGQTSLLLLALLSGALLLAKRDREAPAGLLLGLAAAVKLTPLLVILYFALRGRLRLAAWGAGFFAAASVMAITALGLEVNIQFFTQVVPQMSGGTSYFLNQSLTGLLDRLLTAGDVRQVALQDSAMVKALAFAVSLVLLILTALSFRRPWRRTRPKGLELDLEVSAVILLTLIISPISWSHHYLLAVIPLYTLVGAAARSGRKCLPLAMGIGLAFLLIARKPHADLFLDGVWKLALSAAMYGALILWGACLALLRLGPAAGDRETEVARAA